MIDWKITPELHYTNPRMVIDLLEHVPFAGDDVVLDAGSGRNKVWYKELARYRVERLECEIEDGVDFLTNWNRPVDWVIGNPPFNQGHQFVEKASQIARKGIAFLGSHNFLNSFCLPRRMQELAERGFSVQRIHIVQDKRWFGRYYFLVIRRNVDSSFVSWETETYQ